MTPSQGVTATAAAGTERAGARRRRTYTGPALARRKAWGAEWGKRVSEAAAKLRNERTP